MKDHGSGKINFVLHIEGCYNGSDNVITKEFEHYSYGGSLYQVSTVVVQSSILLKLSVS